MNLPSVVRSAGDFSAWPHSDKIKFFGWYIHSLRNQDQFSPSDILGCYDALHLERPSNVYQSLSQLVAKKPKEVLKGASGYRLEKRVRDDLEARFGRRPSAVCVDKLLRELPLRVPNVAEREFLEEALRCFEAGAFRGAILMCWNLAFDHLRTHILKNHLSAFNQQWPKRFEKRHGQAKIQTISKPEDFSELKESEVIEICRSAGIISGDVFKILDGKLDRRNSAAHPSDVRIAQLQAEEFIDDIVNNVVLKLA